MSIGNLVQVGSTIWLDPENIIGVRWMEGQEPLIHKVTGEVILSGSDGYTQIIHVDKGIYGLSTGYFSSDWPVQKVQAALGLINADDLDEMTK